MSILAFDPAGRPIVSLPINFDVVGHKLSLETFVATSAEYERLISAFNQEVFDGNLQYKIYVFAPASGSFRSVLGIVILTGFTALTATIFGDFGDGFIQGLTGQTSRDWGSELGETLRQELQRNSEKEVEEEEVSQVVATHILVQSSKKFMERSTKELSNIGITSERFPDSFSAKNSFYQALEMNPQVAGVGFGDIGEFPVSRDGFALRVTNVANKDDITWEFETQKFFVTSPNWDRRDKHRGWKGRDTTGNTVYFSVSDPSFWLRFDNGEIHSDTIDELIVQVAVRVENGKKKNRVVLNVISYNDDKLSNELTDEELSQRLISAGLSGLGDLNGNLFE